MCQRNVVTSLCKSQGACSLKKAWTESCTAVETCNWLLQLLWSYNLFFQLERQKEWTVTTWFNNIQYFSMIFPWYFHDISIIFTFTFRYVFFCSRRGRRESRRDFERRVDLFVAWLSHRQEKVGDWWSNGMKWRSAKHHETSNFRLYSLVPSQLENHIWCTMYVYHVSTERSA